MGEKKNTLAKVDMVIEHISDCILELDSAIDADVIPPMVKALAKLVNARTWVDTIDVNQ